MITALAAYLFPLVTAASSDDLGLQFDQTEIVILGEIHDNPAHHTTQARIVGQLQPDALVFEMIEPAVARQITSEMRRNAASLEHHLRWENRGWPDFAMYYPIFAAAPESAIFGAALSRDLVRQAITDGAAQVFGGAAPLFGLDQDLPAAQFEQRLQLQQAAHCNALPEDMLPGMVEAQRLRDAALARAAVAAFEMARAASDTPQVIVITGNGHAREDWGMTAMLRAYYSDDPAVDIAALAQFEGEAPENTPFTTHIVTETADRDDPCDAFK